MNISIRTAKRNDVKSIMQLTEELGYSSSENEISGRLKKILDSKLDKVFVSVSENNEITGWIHVFGSLRVESDPFAEIGGLVVKTENRSKGIGKKLVKTAENWAKDNGYNKIRVRSRIIRKEAHKFYKNKNYILTKEQAVFDKKL